ncbi:hypothetical protein ACFLXP_06260 [Chloroflexota bacterium]
MGWLYIIGILIVVIGAIIFFRRKSKRAERKMAHDRIEKREEEMVEWTDGAAARGIVKKEKDEKDEKKAELADKAASSGKANKIEADGTGEQEKIK